MKIIFHKNFKKQYKKLPEKTQQYFDRRLVLFLDNEEHPLLHCHPLKGEMIPLWSMNITGDFRALYIKNDDTVTFHFIGSHSELYGK